MRTACSILRIILPVGYVVEPLESTPERLKKPILTLIENNVWKF